jgi:hypothetical protein
MNVPYTAVHFSVYESAKKLLNGRDGGASSDGGGASSSGGGGGGGGAWALDAEGAEPEEGLAVQVFAGGLAGGAAAAITTPLDVVKTRLQTEGVHSPKRYRTSAVVRGGRSGGEGKGGGSRAAGLRGRGCGCSVHGLPWGRPLPSSHPTPNPTHPRPLQPCPQLPVLQRIAQEEGAAALWRGIGPRVLFHAPSAAVCWGTYESMKALLAA